MIIVRLFKDIVTQLVGNVIEANLLPCKECDMKMVDNQKYRVVGSNPTYIFKQFRRYKWKQ